MKKLKVIFCIIVCSILLASISILASDIQNDIYHTIVSRVILVNESKISMAESILPGVKKTGERAIQKIKFLKNNMEILIIEMINQKVGYKSYQIQYFLNKKFFNYLKKGEAENEKN